MSTAADLPGRGLTGLDHETSEAVACAGEWLSTTSRERIGRPIIPVLRERFGLSAPEAIEAVREANLRRARAL
ncbi:MAG: hypothetical protein E5V75_23995 [Mesorhizobium sp.]|nr:MAG: hypothetical protein E5V75_23995 [Mesorhizobium sp.]